MGGLLALAFAAGMVAPVNPCGFALLPAWITLSLGDTTHHTALAGRLARALPSGVALTIGFAGTLVAVGLIVSAGAHAVIKAAPWLGLATGVVLLLFAGAMLTGRSLGLRLPGIGAKPAARGHGVGQSVAYGVGFAGASLSCTFGVLLAVIAQAQATATYTGLIVVFAVYAAGAATVLLLLAIATAIAGTALTRRTASLARYGPTLTAIVLAVTGTYLIWYWYPTAVTGDRATSGTGLTSVAATAATWVQAHGTLIALSATGAVLLALAVVIHHHRTRRITDPGEAADPMVTDPEGCCAPALTRPQTPARDQDRREGRSR
ncbi:cytochrome c biogenesis protein CcdA [Nocardioides rotundus]|jgi:cytochrome c biogenesis protein CcdA|uniref:Cytochrome c biogenesis protein CcdA n=1 Tax=Nocardioides marinus TaxID=374514 RepID=A0A7Y9YC02_9ACTN|nr:MULTISPECIES: cytochrome c biogenesis protein CcdA [Nocardioides]NYI09406.1 cytochrome c biogenesis protein CcdA [Nocardioides marinus]UAL29928.1 cytochrome c biogenesis protein CcdA [Nocardioides rotundus]